MAARKQTQQSKLNISHPLVNYGHSSGDGHYFEEREVCSSAVG